MRAYSIATKALHAYALSSYKRASASIAPTLAPAMSIIRNRLATIRAKNAPCYVYANIHLKKILNK